MLRYLCKQLFWILLFASPLTGLGQTTSFIQYGVENGLIQSQIQTLLQDENGELWIGTLGGISRYNGLGFKNFTRKDSMAEDWVTSSYTDKLGNLWFGHWGGGVTVFNPELKKFINLNVEMYTRFKSVNTIMEDAAGSIWLGTEGAGIYKFNPVVNKMISITTKEGISGDNVTALRSDDKGNIWIGTDRGVCVYDSDDDITSPSSYGYLSTENGAIGSDQVTCLFLTEDEVWIGTKDAGVYVLKIKGPFTAKSVQNQSENIFRISETEGLGSNNIKTIYADRAGNVWVGTQGGGVARLRPGKDGGWADPVVKNYSTRQGLNFYNVNAILEDREGNLWIGTDVGLNQYRGERFQLFDEADGMNNNLVWANFCDSEGNIWLGTNRGVSKMQISRNAKGVTDYKVTNFTMADGLTGNAVLSIFQDSDGDIWFACGFGGICRMEKQTQRIRSMNTAENGLSGQTVYTISEDKFRNIWIGTKSGAWRYDRADGSFRRYTVDDGLGGNTIYRIFNDSRGNLWFGALGGNLTSYDGSSFRKYNEEEGMRHRFILSITEDQNGNVWFGAYGGGLYKYNGQQFINYNVEHGLSSPSPYAIVADKGNRIWIGTTNGIDRFDAVKFTFRHYGKDEGFFGVETNPNAVCMDLDKRIWFGTIVGAVKFDPEEDQMNRTEPITRITGLQMFLRDTVFPIDNIFAYDQNHLTFRFAGVSLTNPGKVRYLFRLHGFEEEWSPLLSKNEVTYASLPHGEYTFQVKAMNSDGLLNAEPSEYKFTITPPFWKTKWFYFLCIVVGLLLILVTDRLRVSKLRTDKSRLEKMVESRTLELAYKNEELAEKNRDITDSIKYAKRIQDNILPTEKTIRKFIADYFILFKPKDIVSGDFYWMHQQGNNVLIAAVDCTGHGVPGAFMSIVGNNLLNQAVENMPGIDTAEILNRLNKGLSETMKLTSVDDDLRDGMDISLININFSRKELMYSGAYNPVYIVRNGNLHELQADKISIGGYDLEPDRKYGSQMFTLEKGDSVYLFTDGYTDQFGGPNGKKFKFNQFKNLITDIQSRTMPEQKQLLERNFEDWRGELEQVDDICVIGIRI
ncbi:MAG: SpoIIE family protein phosphatase [Bacteroidia bacterium]|nr:SpoIIE family protein phosphatase [Bacteroidia bacterium]